MWRENLRLGGSRADFGWAASLLEQHRDKIIANYRERLRAIDSPLLSCPEMEKQLELQAQAIVEDVARVFRGGIESLQRADDRISEVLGASRANQRVHPSDSLMAAVELSESILLKVTIESQSEMSTEELTLAASVIYRCTIERVAKASVSYGDYLLSKIHKSNIDERRRVSRELHDRVANSLAVVYQNVNLYKTLKDKSIPQAEEKLRVIEDASKEALFFARELSTELRQSATSCAQLYTS